MLGEHAKNKKTPTEEKPNGKTPSREIKISDDKHKEQEEESTSSQKKKVARNKEDKEGRHLRN
jgi:hypothetical protein